jgi:hypothetical protein
MARAAVAEFDQFFLIVACCFHMAVQTPAHVHHLWIFGDVDLGHIAVAFFTVPASRNVCAVVELDEVRDDGNRHPFNGCAADDCILQRSEQGAGLCLLDLVMTRPAFLLCGNSSGRSLGGAWMAVETLDAESNVGLVRELNRLRRRLLGLIEPKCCHTEQRQEGNPHRD